MIEQVVHLYDRFMVTTWPWVAGLGFQTIAGMLVAFALLERFFPAEKGQPWSAYFLNLRITAIYVVASSVWGGFAGASIAWAGAWLGLGLIDLRFSAGGSLGLQVAAGFLSVVIADFFYYWFHRTQHTFPALWAQHKVHHLDEHLNTSTAMRHHWLEELFRIPFLAIPIAVLFKLDPGPAGLFGLLFAAWGYFIHANLRLELGPLTALLGGPQVHRIHHSRLEEHYDKNFAAFFPMWDILFGTYHRPRAGEFPPTGIEGERVDTAREAAVIPFRIWLRPVIRWLEARHAAVLGPLRNWLGVVKK
ncbi:sterol desaturase family protein [Bosea sp. R86505]|uniref:sterol desaturase family protein n=1 Tax=Bosea sp. R86505 TaxID=3101710 RepID=UPI0036724F3D